MTLLFVAMVGGYALGAVAAALSPSDRYFVQSIEYRSEIVPWFERYLYGPAIAQVKQWAVRARALQSGSAHAYLTYLVIALLGLLTMLLVRGM
jgi:hypothetical protein